MISQSLHQPFARSLAAPKAPLLPGSAGAFPQAGADVVIRQAMAADQAAIVALVHSERLNPYDLRWERFWVALAQGAVIAAAQIRHHADGAREVGSVVVESGHRHRGVASRLLDAMLAKATDELYLVTGGSLVGFYGRWDFTPIGIAHAPRSVRANFWLGQVIGGALSCLHGHAPRRLYVLRRSARTGVPVNWPGDDGWAA
jgi:N-acetylglutamate synthase-like GNAT family acetyltransferase